MLPRFALRSLPRLASCALAVAGAWQAGAAAAALKPHALFSDNGVLQQGVPLPVWGTTDGADKVTVAIAGQVVSAEPKDGKWRVELAPLDQSATPNDMVIRQGDQSLTIKNLLVGEVWICAGGSNMEWTVSNSDGATEAIATSANEQIRLITVPRGGAPQPETDINAKWQPCGPDTVRNFSAVGYFFGRDLQRDCDAPVGLISCNVSGTPAERWTCKASLEADPQLKNLAGGDLYNHMIAPLAPFRIRGFLWYQGEANRTRPKQYRRLLPAMIKCWRDVFNVPDAPFLIVELAPFMKISGQPQDSQLAELRDAQLWVSQNTPHCGLAVTTDIGDEKDIHPRQKAPVGQRLALAARALAYGEKIEYSGPMFDHVSISGPEAIVSFTHVGAGLLVKGDSLTGFTIAGEDRKFFSAKARIEGATVIVSSEEVPKPVAVRYGWSDFPVVNLWNKQDLPACPFRSDDFPIAGP
jgi:sialate O-acetylesterase